MAIDVEQALKDYEHAPTAEPMHGRAGEIRRNPSQDQKRERRELTRKAKLEEPMPETEASLLSKAAKATTLAEQQALVAEAERLRTAKIAQADADKGLDLVTARINDTLVPGFVHERVSEASDWLLELPTRTASLDDASRKMVAEATMWFGRVSDDVKAYPGEFAEQAKNLGRRLASQHGDDADALYETFIAEAQRLYKQAVKHGKIAVALEGEEAASGIERMLPGAAPRAGGGHEPDVLSGKDTQGLQQDSDSFVSSQLASKAAARHHGQWDEEGNQLGHNFNDPESRELVPVSGAPKGHPVGGDPVEPEPPAAKPQVQHYPTPRHPREVEQPSPMMGAGDKLVREFSGDVSGLQGYSDAFIDSQLRRAASLSREANIPAADATAGPPVNVPERFAQNPVTDTSSNRSPALQEIQNFNGYGGYSSVVPVNDPGLGSTDDDADLLNDNTSGTQDASENNPVSSAGFPVGASLAKESTMTQEHAQCPTCGGQGRVAVRKEAYSGLPQIDQIVNADESPGTTPYPAEVAFPITGWVPGNVEQTIAETEQQIAGRPRGVGGAPGAPAGPGGSVAASRRTANGRDNSGWIGDMGAKGIDYPGYSTPTGYDGSSNLGQPDPVYGYGGDQVQGPKKPYGAQEADDITNNPGQPYDPSVPHNNDQGYREVSPGMSTSGSRDPFIAAAQSEIVRQQRLIAQRSAMLARQQG